MSDMARPTTPHYGLIQYGPQGTGDPLGVYSVYNPTMKTLDDILFELKGLIDDLESRMDEAEGRLDGHDQAISSLSQQLAELRNYVDQQIASVRSYVDQQVSNVKSSMTATDTDLWSAIEAIVAHVQGGGTVSRDDGSISWGTPGSLAVGNINLTSGSGYIRTHAVTDQANDLKAV